MKKLRTVVAATLVCSLLAGPLTLLGAEGKKDKPKPYPLDTCVVSGEKLGSMGEAVLLVHAGQEVKFCCKGCIKDFKKEPAKYMKKIDEANKKKKA